jgi:hypothetical protein
MVGVRGEEFGCNLTLSFIHLFESDAKLAYGKQGRIKIILAAVPLGVDFDRFNSND